MRYLTILFIILFWTLSLQAQVNIVLEIDNDQPAMGDHIELKVRVEGSQYASEPQIEGLDSFVAQSQGTSSQIQIVNGRTTVQKVYTYSLFPKQVGTFNLGPAKVEVDGDIFKSRAIQIKVAKEHTQKGIPQQKSHFIKAYVDKEAPYVSEQVIYTFQLFSRGEIYNAKLELPEFDGFWKQEIGKQRSYSKRVNGIEWRVTEIRYLLLPLSAGKIIIPSTSLMATTLVRQRERRRKDPRRQRGRGFFDSFF